MRCQACDKNLADWESTHKNPETDEYTDLCAKCLNIVVINTTVDEFKYDPTYEQEDDVEHVKERPSDFDYYEEDWDKYD